MYIPPAFRVDELPELQAMMRAARLVNLVTSTADGLIASPLPLMLDATEGPYGTLYGHLAKANPQWRLPVQGQALAIFMGPDAYITPSWYATKRATGQVVPTWNYLTVHAYGEAEFFQDADRLLALVSRLTDRHESPRPDPWAVSDAPVPYIQSQLKGIVGLRLPIARLEGKRKVSQNRTAEDRAGVVQGLAASEDAGERMIAGLIPR